MLILVLLGMYFDAAVVFVTSQTLLLKLAVAILWSGTCVIIIIHVLTGNAITTNVASVNGNGGG